MHLQNSVVGEDDVMNVFFDFDDILVFGVDGVNTDGMEDNAVLCHDFFGDAARDFVDVGNG